MKGKLPPVQAPIPPGWEVNLWLSQGEGPHRATIERSGVIMCSLIVSDHDHDADGAAAVLKVRAAAWIAEYLARRFGG